MKKVYKSFCMIIAITIFLTGFNFAFPFAGIQSNIVNAQSVPSEAMWIPRDSGTDQSINDITYGNGLFVAVGDGGTILTSGDGRLWTPQSPSPKVTTNLHKIIFAESRFVIAGASGVILTSTNGVNWEKRDSKTTNDLNDIAYGNGNS